MNKLNNERGVALLTALLLTLISMLIVLAVLYYITQGIVVSASHKRYKSARDAAYGGTEVFTRDIIPQVMQGNQEANITGLLSPAFQHYSCLTNKLNNPPGKWNEHTQYGYCAPADDSNSTNITGKPDMTFTLRGAGLQPNYKVATKITDTVPGNTDNSGYTLLDSGAGVAYGDAGGVTPVHIPATYRVEVQAQKETNPSEKAWLSVLYAY